MKLKNKFISILLSVILTISMPLSIFANGLTQKELLEIYNTGEQFTEVLGIIQTNYVGKSLNNTELLQNAIKGLTNSLDDYSEFFTEEEYKGYMTELENSNYIVGISYTINTNGYPVVEQIIENSPAEKIKLVKGDIITTFNGIDLKDKVMSKLTSDLVSNKKFDVELKILRGNKELTFSLKLEPVTIKSVSLKNLDELLNDKNIKTNVGYIKITSFSSDTADLFKKAMQTLLSQNKKRLILDLRGNGGGLVDPAIEICRMLVPAGNIITMKDKAGNVLNEISSLGKSPFEKIVVLTDENTASSSEIVTSALKESGAAITVGRNTFGKGIMQSLIPLNGLGALKFTTYEFFSRNNKKLHEVGISPTVKVDSLQYVSPSDDINSSNLKNILSTLGYSTSSNEDIISSIKKIQKNSSLGETGTLTENTVKSINGLIYDYLIKNDRELIEGYNQIIK